MPQASRTFRIFISSTFSDQSLERNALQERVFPKIRDLCEKKGCHFQAIDLRWGVGKESSLDQKTMKICLDELTRCQEMSPKPNFIVLLGDRYGWRPLPYEIEATEFEEVVKHVDKKDQGLIHKWYKWDDNAIPAVYLLQPVREDEKEEWDKEERILHAALLDGARKAGLAPLALFKYESSATEQEIEKGVMQVEKPQEHVFCFFRNITGFPLDVVSNKYDESARDFVDMDKDGNADSEARGMLDDLRGRLREKLDGKLKEKPNANVFEYDAVWQGDGGKHPVTRDHLDKLCDDVYASLSRIIEEEVEKLESIDPLEEEIKVHKEVASEHSKFFTGRVKILDTISRYVRSDSASTLAIYGKGGMGKTALVSCAALKAEEEHPDARVIYRFIGQTPESSDIAKLLESICTQVRRDYGKEELSSPESGERSYEKLIAEFRTCLTFSTDDEPLILFIDSLDQLSNSNNPQSLNWLPGHLSNNTKVIVSTRRGEMLDRLNELIPDENLIELETMPLQEGEELLDKWLEDAGRRLEESQKKVVLSGFKKSENPLYLKLAFEEAKLWASYTTDIELNPSVEGIIADLFGRLSVEKNHGKLLTSRSLGYIAAGRYGLSEEELIDILSLDGEVMDDFQKRSPDSPKVSTLPFIVWSRLYEELKPYLVRKSAQGLSVITFYHRELGKVAKSMYLGSSDGKVRHLFLADYFDGKELSARKTSELPWQIAEGKDWERLYRLLSDLAFFYVIWTTDEYEAKGYWAEIESGSPLKKIKAYEEVIDHPELHHELSWCIARLLQDSGSLDEAKSLYEYYVKRCRESEDHVNLQVALGNLANILKNRGDLAGAMKIHKESENICRELGIPDGLQASLNNQANILCVQGKFGEAMKLFKESERICRELGILNRLQASLGNQAALILQTRGDLDGAMKLLGEQEKICRELGIPDGLQFSLGTQAVILQRRGDLDGAMKLHKEKEKICRELGNPDGLQASLGNQAFILQDQGDLEGAMKLLGEQERICRELGNPNGLQASLGIQANILHEQGDLDGAMKLLKEQEKICRELGNPDGLQASLGNQALILQDQGDLEGAMKLLEEKEKICRELGLKEELSKSLANHALIIIQTGHPEEALSLAKEAYEIASSAGSVTTAKQIERIIQEITIEWNQGSRKGEGKVETAQRTGSRHRGRRRRA